MTRSRKRTVSVDLPDALVRRAARHVGPHASFGAIMEHALELWLSREEAGRERCRSTGEAAAAPAIPPAREAI
jgi:hypothetical protein